MSKTIRILLIGESWISTSTHIGLFHLPGHRASAEFPLEEAGLADYDVLILSDIGANTLLLHPDVWVKGTTVPNHFSNGKDTTGYGSRRCSGW